MYNIQITNYDELVEWVEQQVKETPKDKLDCLLEMSPLEIYKHGLLEAAISAWGDIKEFNVDEDL